LFSSEKKPPRLRMKPSKRPRPRLNPPKKADYGKSF
jgi:hypothetical protein